MLKHLSTLLNLWRSNKPVVVAAVSILGVAATAVSSANSAHKITVREMQQEYPNFKPTHIVKNHWKTLLAPTVTAVGTVSAIAFSHKLYNNSLAAVAWAAASAETAVNEYKDIVNTLPPGQKKKFNDNLQERRIEKSSANNTVSNAVVIEGDVLCYDELSGRTFSSNARKIREAVNGFNNQLFHDVYLSLNELYSAMGLAGVTVGDDLGWSAGDLVQVNLTASLEEHDHPCLSVEFQPKPSSNYHKINH